METRLTKQRNKTRSKKREPVTTFRASVIDVGGPVPRQEDSGRMKGDRQIWKHMGSLFSWTSLGPPGKQTACSALTPERNLNRNPSERFFSSQRDSLLGKGIPGNYEAERLGGCRFLSAS